MIHLMLNNLRRPAGEGFGARLHVQGLVLHLDCLIALTLTRAAEKRQAAFLGVISAVLLDDFGIEYHRVGRDSSTFVEKGNYTLAHTDHIRCHANTSLPVCHQRIKQVLCDL